MPLTASAITTVSELFFHLVVLTKLCNLVKFSTPEPSLLELRISNMTEAKLASVTPVIPKPLKSAVVNAGDTAALVDCTMRSAILAKSRISRDESAFELTALSRISLNKLRSAVLLITADKPSALISVVVKPILLLSIPSARPPILFTPSTKA